MSKETDNVDFIVENFGTIAADEHAQRMFTAPPKEQARALLDAVKKMAPEAVNASAMAFAIYNYAAMMAELAGLLLTEIGSAPYLSEVEAIGKAHEALEIQTEDFDPLNAVNVFEVAHAHLLVGAMLAGRAVYLQRMNLQ